MRVFAVSDLHTDYGLNRKKIANLSKFDHQDDILIVAGDISHTDKLVRWTMTELVRSFSVVMFVPGNHDLWVADEEVGTSLEKFYRLCQMAEECGVTTREYHHKSISIVPLFCWYNFSFGPPSAMLKTIWQDFRRCRWDMPVDKVTQHFLELNVQRLKTQNETIISFSHFLPRLDIMKDHRPERPGFLEPILGSTALDGQIRELKSSIHLFGHFHKPSRLKRDGVVYVNNALGYPSEQSPRQRLLLQLL